MPQVAAGRLESRPGHPFGGTKARIASRSAMTVETNRTLTAVANGPVSSPVLPGVRPAATSGRVTGDRRRLRRTLTADVQIAVVNAAPTVSSVTRDRPLRPDRVSLSSSGSDETALCPFRVRRRRGTHAPKQSLNLGRKRLNAATLRRGAPPECAGTRRQSRARDPTTAPAGGGRTDGGRRPRSRSGAAPRSRERAGSPSAGGIRRR